MANIQPFRAIRPTRDKASLVATRSYLSYNEETIKEKLNHNPYTFLHVINPDYNKNLRSEGKAKYELIKQKIKSYIKSQILFKEGAKVLFLIVTLKETLILSINSSTDKLLVCFISLLKFKIFN